MGIGPEWTNTDKIRLTRLRKEGLSYRAISFILGRSEKASQRKASEMGIVADVGAPRRPKNTKIANAVIAAYGGTESASKIARRLNISRNAVCGMWARARRDGIIVAERKQNDHA